VTATFELIDAGNDTSIVACSGEVDLSAAKNLRATLLGALASRPGGHLVVDLTEVSFLDAPGLGVIVGSYQRAAAAGGRLTVVASQANVLKMLRLTGFDQAWDIAATREEALAEGR
jgi:anti-sigma B factor antagonist